MALSPRLELRQSQSLIMTPQLQQAIKLLQYSSMELAAFVDQELERNPFLEREESSQTSATEEAAGNADDRSSPDAIVVEARDGDGDAEAPLDIERNNDFDEGSPGEDPDGLADRTDPFLSATSTGPGSGSGSGGTGDDLPGLEQTVSSTTTLREHLLEQINLSPVPETRRFAASVLVDHLDDAGWLGTDLSEIADTLGLPYAEALSALELLHTLDPVGIGARSLAECLKLQLAERDRLDPAMATLVDHLDLLAARDFARLRSLCGVDSEDLADMVEEIRALNPKPALAFGDVSVEAVTPDIVMTRQADGAWRLDLHPDALPRVLVTNTYMARVNGHCSAEDRTFITENLQTANWLVKALHQRAGTILKVATELVRQQQGFFDHGVSHLKPLVLRDIADAVEMHESTISRVTSNKYIDTPRGLFELKYFFTQALPSSGGEGSVSAESVRHRIKALCDAEAPKAILSDDKLVDILKAEGVDVARRTVAKYRDALGIPSSVQRRRQKNPKL